MVFDLKFLMIRNLKIPNQRNLSSSKTTRNMEAVSQSQSQLSQGEDTPHVIHLELISDTM